MSVPISNADKLSPPRGLSPAWRRWYLRCLPAYWVFLFLTTHFPKLQLQGAPPQSDKVIHFVAFGLLAFLFWRFFEALGSRINRVFFVVAAATLAMYSGMDEYLQQFVGRGSDWGDWYADVTGIAIVLGIMILLEMRRRRRG